MIEIHLMVPLKIGKEVFRIGSILVLANLPLGAAAESGATSDSTTGSNVISPPDSPIIGVPGTMADPMGSSPPTTLPLESQGLSTPPAQAAASPVTPGITFPNFGGLSPNSGGFAGRSSGFAGRPSGFAAPSGGFPLGSALGGDLMDGFSLSTTLSGTYDSNPSMGYESPDSSGGSDYFLTLGGAAAYRSKASTWTFGLSYSGSYSEYFTQSELSGYNQSAGGTLNYQSGPLNASLNVGVGFGSGANRYYSSVVDEISCSYGLNASYRISSKTSLNGNFSQALTSASGGSSSDTGSFNMGVSAMWKYSPLTELGPGIRYTSDSGNSDQKRTSIGPTMTVNYKLSKKVSLNSMVGLEFSEYEGGQSADPATIAMIALNYQASRLWGMNLSLHRDTQADPSAAGGFTEVTGLRLGYNRKIRRASWNLGMSYETNSSQTGDGATSGARPDRDYLTFDSSIGMPVFSNTTSVSLFVNYSDQSGNAADSFDSFQTGFSISRSF